MKYQVLFAHDQAHRAIDAGIIAQRCRHDGGLAAGGECIGLEMLAQGGKQHVPGAGHAGTHDELLAKQGVYYRLWNQLPGKDTL